MATSGSTANRSGRHLERSIIAACRTWSGYDENTRTGGIRVIPYPAWVKAGKPCPALVKNVPFQTVYGTNGRSEFGLFLPGRSIRIECKWQRVPGSVDEKFPYLLLNMVACSESEVIVICGGKGAKRAAIEWLVRNAKTEGPKAGKTITVWDNSDDFSSWAQAFLPAYFPNVQPPTEKET